MPSSTRTAGNRIQELVQTIVDLLAHIADADKFNLTQPWTMAR